MPALHNATSELHNAATALCNVMVILVSAATILVSTVTIPVSIVTILVSIMTVLVRGEWPRQLNGLSAISTDDRASPRHHEGLGHEEPIWGCRNDGTTRRVAETTGRLGEEPK